MDGVVEALAMVAWLAAALVAEAESGFWAGSFDVAEHGTSSWST